MDPSSDKGEVMRNAQRLLKAKGDGAFEYASKMADRMQDIGDEKDQAFWEKISKQVELLLCSDD